MVLLTVLAGGAVLLGTGNLGPAVAGIGDAAAGLFDRTAGPSPTETAPPAEEPLGAPLLTAPEQPYTRQDAWEVQGSLPDAVVGRPGYRVRVFVNGELSRTRRVTEGERFRVGGLTLRPGENRITAVLRGPDGDGPPSEPVTVVLDQEPPPIVITSPTEGQVVNGDSMQIEGTTQPGSRVRIRNVSRGRAVIARADQEGNFAGEVPIARDGNTIVLTATDPAGNQEQARVAVTKGDGVLEARLSLSATRFRLEGLPAALTMRVTVRDPDGAPVEGAAVTFSLSTPGQPTSTYEDVTVVNGTANWSSVTIPASGALTGTGLVTALVVLPDGKTLRATAEFEVVE